jgi:hypothetical protein
MTETKTDYDINVRTLSKELYDKIDRIEEDVLFLMNELKTLRRKIQIVDLPQGEFKSLEDFFEELKNNGIQ